MARLFFGKSLRRSYDRSAVLRNVMWLLEAMLVALFWGLCVLFPVDRASRLGRRVMAFVGPRTHKNRQVMLNLAIMFPAKTEAERLEIARAIWANFGATFAEYPHLDCIIHRQAERRIRVAGEEYLSPYVNAGKPVIFATAHLANWEIPGSPIIRAGIPATAVYSPQQNPFVEWMMQRMRRAIRGRYVRKDAGIRQLYRVLAANGALVILPDQRVERGKAVPFFGIDASTTDSPARLALKYHCDLVPVRIERLEDAHFRATFYPPLQVADDGLTTQEKALQLTHSLNALFESWIRERPQEWLCVKRRWPKQRGAKAPVHQEH